MGAPTSFDNGSLKGRVSFAFIGVKGDAPGTALYSSKADGAGGTFVEKCLVGCSD
jgi:hypothetical protein